MVYETHDDYNHARPTFPPSENTTQYQNDDCDWNSGDRQVKLNTSMLSNNDDELDGESNKKEEVELQQGDVDLTFVSYWAVNRKQNLEIPGRSNIVSSSAGLH